MTGPEGVMSVTGSNNMGAAGSVSGPAITPAQSESTTRDKEVKKRWVLDQLQRLRNFRRPYDQRRAYYYRQYIGQRDRKMFPDNITPRSNTFVPIPNSDTEAIVSRVHDAFFSLDPWLEVRPTGPYDWLSMQSVLMTTLKKAKITKQIELFTRDLCIYGHAGVKVDWDWDFDVAMGPEPVYQQVPVQDPQTGAIQRGQDGQPQMQNAIDPNTGQPIQIGTKMVQKAVPRNCPKIIPIDIYDLLIDPDEKMKAHVFEISWGELQREATAKPDRYFPEAITELTNRLRQYQENDRDGIIIRVAEFWDDTNKTVSMVSFGEDADAIGWKDRRYQYRNASYSAYKRRVYNGPPVMLYTGPNPFAHQRIPIIDAAYIKVKGDVYGIGLIEKISDLAEGINVFTNMVTDNWNLGINHRYAYDVQMDIDHDQLDQGNTPGGKVGVVGDPSKAIFPLPNYTPNSQDYQIIDLYKGMIEQVSGISDFYAKGVGSSGGNRTSSGISQVINQSGYVFKLLIRNMENDVLQPMLEMCASLIMQYGTDQMEYEITNAPPGIPKYGTVELQRLVGTYAYDLVAANYATGKEVKQRNLMAFYQIAMQSPYAVQSEFLKEIARCMEIPYANRLLKTDEQVQQQQQAAHAQQLQEAIMEKLLNFEEKALVKELGKTNPSKGAQPQTPEQVHALEVQENIEEFIQIAAGIPLEGEGLPVNHMHEGHPPGVDGMHPQIPGVDEGTMNNAGAQQIGANAF